MLILLAVHAVAAVSLPLVAERLGRPVWPVAAAVPAAAVVWAAVNTPRALSDAPPEEHLTWAPTLGLGLVLRLDALSLLMVYVVGGVGAAILVYCTRYFGPGSGREAGLLVAFAGTMLGLVTADHLLALYVFWELTTVVSFLLIAGRGQSGEHRSAAQQALLTTAAGGLAMLLGFLLLGREAGTYRISELVAEPPRGGVVTLALALVLLGAFAKSAQLPFSAWLPAAMVAPTPVSAYLHAAAMVKAGVYLVARLAPAFAAQPPWRPLVLVVGLVTMVLGAWAALRQTDLKLLLAYGTVSELGMLIALLGTGQQVAALAGAVMLLAHASFKSALFLCVGILDHEAGTRDLRRLSGVGRRRPLLCAAAALAAASMAGVPPLVGFLGKEAAYEAFLHGHFAGHRWALAALVLGSVLTVAYSARFLWGAFGTKPGTEPTTLGHAEATLSVPVTVPAAAGLVLGLGYPALQSLIGPYAAEGLPGGGATPYELKLWHGPTLTLLLSALTLVLGLAVHYGRGAMAAVRGLPAPPDGRRGYELAVHGVDRLALWLTRRTQVGSLPVYLTVLLMTVLLVPGTALLVVGVDLPWSTGWHSALQLPLTLMVLAAAGAVAVTRHRLGAVLLTSAVGYGIAGLFLVQGAPDLALTQFLVETLTLVVMVLVLRQLPHRFRPERALPSTAWLKGTVAVGMGVFVGFFAMVASAARQEPSPTAEYLRLTPETGAHNAVNAIIVDFRALDTFGEISVLLVTAIGVTALIGYQLPRPLPSARAAVRRALRSEPHRAARWDAPRDQWLPEARDLPRHERSLLLEVVVRLIFPSVLVFSLYLLFVGHSRPGGGFVGGLVAGQAFVLRHLVGGRADTAFTGSVSPRAIAGGSLALVAMVALLPPAAGGAPLSSIAVSADLPLLGQVKFATSLFFDVGIYFLVIGVTLMLLAALGKLRGAHREEPGDEEPGDEEYGDGEPAVSGPGAGRGSDGGPGAGDPGSRR